MPKILGREKNVSATKKSRTAKMKIKISITTAANKTKISKIDKKSQKREE